MFIFPIHTAHAAIPTQVAASLILTTDLNGDGIAAIGDTVEARIEFIASPSYSGASISFVSVGGPASPLAITTLDSVQGRYYGTCAWTVVAGSFSGAANLPVTITNADGSLSSSVAGTFDTKPPVRSS
ncbi:MAG TPA: hypothetical protein PLY73_15670, partial [Candidatus Ozemobacteraceae bacterium]|nr:hypothetical protein [Candidatus Ozemobacteraceae bacterium]